MDATATTIPITQQIPVDKIVPSPFQARKHFDEQKLKELAQTIQDRGLENAILVRPVGDTFELIAGERRWRAAKLLGWQTIEAKVEAVDDREAVLKGLVENVQREDLSAIEQAQGYLHLTLPPFNLNQGQVGQMTGKDQGLISKYLAVAKLGDGHLENYERFINLGLRHLLELTRIPNVEDQLTLAELASKSELSVHELKSLVDQKVGPKKAKVTTPTPTPRPTDPLETLWPMLAAQSSASGIGFWGVSYGPHSLPNSKEVTMPAWQFWIANQGASPQNDLVQWFRLMAEALSSQGATSVSAGSQSNGYPKGQEVTETPEYLAWKAEHPEEEKAMLEKARAMAIHHKR